jgi:peptidoglycan/xylan/chitin deacetylase (PgdA/CDA1 family)
MAGTGLVSALARVVAPSRGRLLVLIYHRVHDASDELFPREPTRQGFRWQMELLARHLRPLPLTEAVQGLAEDRLPARAVAVTFDDGYADNEAIAAPILSSVGVPATFFVTTAYLDGGRMWNDTVIETVRHARAGVLGFAALGIEPQEIGDGPSRRRLVDRIIGAIKHRPQAERQRLADEIAAAVVAELPRDLMMRSAQVQSLARAGFEIGGHTVTHPILLKLSPEQARGEILDGKARLEALLGRPLRLFAYPNGRPGEDYGPEHVAMVREAGFEAAVSTRRGVGTGASDRFQLPRFTPWDQTPERFLARMLLEYRNAA